MAETGYVYYFSDPDSANPTMHHLVIPLAFKVPELPWHWHTEKPNESLKDAVWDSNVNGWVENDKNSQSAILAKAEQKIDQLNQTQQASAQQSLAVTQQLAGLMKAQSNQTKVLQAVQQTLGAMNKELTESKNGGAK